MPNHGCYTNPACVDGACPNVDCYDDIHVSCDDCAYGYNKLGCAGCLYEGNDGICREGYEDVKVYNVEKLKL